ncbi:MAG: class III lanthipeptide [Pyrinomonadaceae bacterium]|nr:class III lanthipeptide [Pyrinomonadaceae bacterium]
MERVLSLQTLSEYNDPVDGGWSTFSNVCSSDTSACSSASNGCGGPSTREW